MGKKSRKASYNKVASGKDSVLLKNWKMIAAVGFIAMLVATIAAEQMRSQPRLQSYNIVRTYPHDPDAFTQGLEYDRVCEMDGKNCTDVLWESTGMNGASEVRLVDLISGKVIRSTRLDPSDFGEGLVKAKDRLLQLTWRSNKVLSYKESNLEDVQELHTALKDGWGITHSGGAGTNLVISDGSAALTFVDPATLQTLSTLQVADNGRPVKFLNELEWVRGEIWANVWQTECIARIHPKSGAIRGWILLHGILAKLRKQNTPQNHPLDVLNGIAWDASTKRLFVTGKYWPNLYEIALRPHPGRLRPEVMELARQQCSP